MILQLTGSPLLFLNAGASARFCAEASTAAPPHAPALRPPSPASTASARPPSPALHRFTCPDSERYEPETWVTL